MRSRTIQQGNTLLIPEQTPPNAKLTEKAAIGIIEDSGVKHTLSGIEVFVLERDYFVRVTRPTELRSTSHRSLLVPPGLYRICSLKQADSEIGAAGGAREAR